MLQWQELKDKKVFIILDSGSQYTGIIKEIETAENITFLLIIDKFDKEVIFPISQIVKLEVMENE